MHAQFERLLSKSLTTLEVVTYYLVVHTGPGAETCSHQETKQTSPKVTPLHATKRRRRQRLRNRYRNSITHTHNYVTYSSQVVLPLPRRIKPHQQSPGNKHSIRHPGGRHLWLFHLVSLSEGMVGIRLAPRATAIVIRGVF